MSNEPLVEPNDDDLDAFSSNFFGEVKPKPEESKDANPEEVPEDSDALEDTHENDGDDAPEDETPEDEPEEAPKPKKNRFQERIDELNGKFREEERKRLDTERRLQELEDRLKQDKKPDPTPVVDEDASPTPEDVNEDGTEKYPLGEFDPQYIRDLTKHALKTEREAFQKEESERQKQAEAERNRTELENGWTEKLGSAKERYPDFQEKGETLVSAFEGIDPAYGEYLTSTIMSMDYGPDVLYYLANHQDEAHAIVKSGPAKATLALGRIESKFLAVDEEKQKVRPKISQAPTPPQHVNKGSAVVKPDVEDDTEDLDAFAEKLFRKRGR